MTKIPMPLDDNDPRHGKPLERGMTDLERAVTGAVSMAAVDVSEGRLNIEQGDAYAIAMAVLDAAREAQRPEPTGGVQTLGGNFEEAFASPVITRHVEDTIVSGPEARERRRILRDQLIVAMVGNDRGYSLDQMLASANSIADRVYPRST